MTESSKFFARPKVRFSPVPDNQENNQQTENAFLIPSTKSNGPKIKSIVSIQQPIRIVSQDKSSKININKTGDIEQKHPTADLNLNNGISNLRLSNRSSKTQISPSSQNFSAQWPLSDMSNADNIKANQEKFERNTSTKFLNSNADSSTSSSSPLISKKPADKISNHVENVKQSSSMNFSKKTGKENQTNSKDKVINSKRLKGETTQAGGPRPTSQKDKSVSSARVVRTKAVPNATKVSHSASKANCHKVKMPNTKYEVHGIMPCLKYAKTGIKSKSSPVKKTVTRDIIGQKIKPYVGPGVLRQKKSQVGKESVTNIETQSGISIVATDILSRPDYNSIRCVVNKLNEVKKEKIVTDIENLPTAYKNLVNKKISAALDFLPDEVIYKNLVDLSVDEKQLPSRLIRSKDPEPRQKDILPKLSDFFKPEYTEEYSAAVPIKPRLPDIQESWNAFRISDKIFEWKENIDDGD